MRYADLMQHRYSMGRIGLFLCLSVTILNGCVITYDFPKPDHSLQSLAPGLQYYHVGNYQGSPPIIDPTYYMSAPRTSTYASLERIIIDHGVSSIMGDNPPSSGPYFTATIFPTLPSFWAQYFWALSLVSGFFLPGFSGTGGYLVTYDLYVDGAFQKTYHYEIGRNGMTWVPLLPFMWVNLLTASEEDAFRATTTQFLLDAGRDQHWESS